MTPTPCPHRRSEDARGRARARTPLAALTLLLALFGVACVELEQTIQVRPDGSGMVLSDVLFSEKMVAEMAGDGGDWKAMWQEALPRMEESGPAAAAALGEGVRFVSVEDVSRGSKPAARFTFAFDDVAELRPNPMAPIAGELGAGGAADEAGGDDSIRLSLERSGGNAVLSVMLFEEAELQDLADQAAGAPAAEPDELASQMEKAMLEMFQEMLDGFALRLSVEVLGRIVETNATFVDGARVTLFDLDFGKLLDDPQALARLGDGQEEPSLTDLRAAFAGIQGARIDLQPTVRIAFAKD
jgi:hypothetical protein